MPVALSLFHPSVTPDPAVGGFPAAPALTTQEVDRNNVVALNTKVEEGRAKVVEVSAKANADAVALSQALSNMEDYNVAHPMLEASSPETEEQLLIN